ncbi:hypothetical protein OG21DRAFT_1465137 [Imleria badia]|nr:hypothetical protein OG21DRAFT_1465137 [Imleria badia]
MATLRVIHHGTVNVVRPPIFILFQVTQTIEVMSPTCAAFADQDTLVTGSDDSLVRVWHLAWSVVISSSLDGSAILWDLNRGLYVRSIWHAGGDCSCISSRSTNLRCGYIATCSTYSLWLHTINARPVAILDLRSNVPRARVPCVTSIAFHERDYSHLGILAIGHADGSVVLYTWNAEDTSEDARAQWGFLKVRDLEAEKNDSASITSLDFIG